MDRAKRRLRSMPAMLRSSITIEPKVAASRVVSLCIPSRRCALTRWSTLLRCRFAFSQRLDGCLAACRSAPVLRETTRHMRRNLRIAALRCLWLGTTSPLDKTARLLMPTSTPMIWSGCFGLLAARTISTVKAQNQRLPSRLAVADRIRAVPASSRRASLRVDSWVFIRPILGSVTWCRSGSTRIAPVVNLIEGVVLRRVLNRGKPTRAPARLPDFESLKFFNARATPSRPVLKASLEQPAHQGATLRFA